MHSGPVPSVTVYLGKPLHDQFSAHCKALGTTEGALLCKLAEVYMHGRPYEGPLFPDAE